jgi:hypothetical protein
MVTAFAEQVTAYVRENPGASFRDVMGAFPEKGQSLVSVTLTRLVKRGVLRRTALDSYEVVEPVRDDDIGMFAETERLFRDMMVVEIKMLFTRGPERFAIRGRVREDVRSILNAAKQVRTNYLAQRGKVPEPIEGALLLLEARANELLARADELDRTDPQPEPLRGRRGRPAKYR